MYLIFQKLADMAERLDVREKKLVELYRYNAELLQTSEKLKE